MAAGKRKHAGEKESVDRDPSRKFKKAGINLSSPSKTPSSVIMEDADLDFPRGGGRVLSREEEAEARAEAEAEFEREESSGRKGKGNLRKKGLRGSLTNVQDDLGFLSGDGITGKLPRFANRITLKNISPRMKLWGIVVEVNKKDLAISLPGGLRGFVRAEQTTDMLAASEIKDSEGCMLSSIFHVGQLVACFVVQVDDEKDGKGNKRIWLSLRLSLLYKGLTLDAVQDGMVLNAQVKSMEDHGYIIYFGVSSVTGFLPRNQNDNQLTAGQFIQCCVKSIDKDRAVLYVDSDPGVVAKHVVKDLKGLSIDLLVPGMMVNARVTSVLDNGIMLSFLTYFTGTVDMFHLENAFQSGTWKDNYAQNKKVIARILFVDPSTRAVGLTLNKFLVDNIAPPAYVKTGEIYENSQILRVDKGLGLLLEIPSSPSPSPAYVNTFDASDKTLKLEKNFKEGDNVRVRILGMKHLEGLAIGTLKASAFEGPIFTHSDVKPGMLVKAKVISVGNFDALVQLSSGIKVLCPLRHMSELDIAKPPKKFKVGAELLFRVLGCKHKKITVTYKKSLVKSKLNVVSSYADATEGLLTHGWICKIEKHGCFVRFYNGVQGFAPRSELGLVPGIEADSVFHVGQVVKCRITSIASSRRINLSFITSSTRAPNNDTVKVGCIVSGVVTSLTPTAVIVNLKDGHMKGTIFNEHLADHEGHVTLLRSLLKPGYEFDQLLALDYEGANLILSAKHSLVSSANEIPSDLSQIHPLTSLFGYICNIIESGCFVRFLGRLTGFAPKNMATDRMVDNLSDAFFVGQAVNCHILKVNSEAKRIKLSLKQSLCASPGISYVQGYFLEEDKLAGMQISNVKDLDVNWLKDFRIGSLVEGEIQEIKELGAVIGLKNHRDIVGFLAHKQSGGANLEVGSVVNALVLDIAKVDGIVDLSLKPELVHSASGENKKKRHRSASTDLELHQVVNAVVEMVKENYLVLSVPEYNNAIGFASITDYNIQKLPHKLFEYGQSVIATVGEVPSSESSGRLLLFLNSFTDGLKNSNSKRAKKNTRYTLGSLVEAEVIEIKPLELLLKFGYSLHGRIHISEVFDNGECMENPFAKFSVGQLLNARVVAIPGHSGKGTKGHSWELSIKPSVMAFIGSTENFTTHVEEQFNFSAGRSVTGYVVKVDPEWVWLTVSRSVMANMYILNSSSEPIELENFQHRYSVGQAVSGHILDINEEKKLLQLAAYPSFDFDIVKAHETDSQKPRHAVQQYRQGDIVVGRIKKILPAVGGVLVQIGPHLFGRVHYTELVDDWLPLPLCGYQEGQFVKCKILEMGHSSEGPLHVDLSLRASITTNQHDQSLVSCSKRYEKIDDIHPGMNIQGYVKNITKKGCFISLSKVMDARILLCNLSDDFIDNPEKEFPVGKLLHAKVLSVEPSLKRIEATLKIGETETIKSLHVGDIITGKIRRVESFGLFIAIDESNKVGLCHISKLSDGHIDNIEQIYKTGDTVSAKILKIDEERQRISLGMKKSYLEDGGSIDRNVDVEADRKDDHQNGASSIDNPFLELQHSEDIADGGPEILAQPVKNTSILPLQVSLEESEDSDVDNPEIVNKDDANNNGQFNKKDRRAKKKAEEEKELEISASEERHLQNDIPMTEDEFEKLVRSSPNSSFVWINYMAFMLRLADIKKARDIAERALNTINIREEGEKFNVWVAYLNLENEYGNPPEVAVKEVFQRALQYCDPKKLYLALLGVYERTKQQNPAEELLERMTKKFKQSCKVWLRRIQNFLMNNKDETKLIVNRALLSLPRKKHIKFISQTALLEFKSGQPDRGRSLLESILREYPKRTDLWSIYLDQEIRLGDTEVIRALFERVTCLSLPPKKMKFLFKKYLEYEKAHGDEETMEHVKRRALEYVESSLA
ncbi:rRNA biogenesis protein RRP5-like [Zingiber officinale]|uniref:rRNA biogenesis protein RRP5-like n=1 Tax=Zingiber officinale TaxID=94328 RepID=UPI001C4D46C3|nr:rRNA biogenesis protein RRP5-like [Zingiber officinale]XP_042394410.1 rRNA biogenesis protein RRP5-like [Zingiber officinale]XP_042394411.1 rRNA biogenesis protein RRP5-like [Zingiber officinale]